MGSGHGDPYGQQDASNRSFEKIRRIDKVEVEQEVECTCPKCGEVFNQTVSINVEPEDMRPDLD